LEDNGYGLTLGAKPSFALSDNHTLNFTLLYPVMGKNANQEIYLAFTTDSFIPLPSGPGDRDGDGITDDVDNCPDDPEDFDGFEDSDGCPDPDNDGDGILDVDDRCPNDAEIFNGYEDEDGCPDEVPVPEPPKFDGVIRFYPDSTEPLDGYYTVMDEAGAKLKEAPDAHITLAGHAADTGRPDFEMKLSEGRAMFVKDYHVNKHGIDANRISIVYFGSTKPIADNSTEEGRSQNRRVVYSTDK
jgi:OOP family OmpA-OmpF porin